MPLSESFLQDRYNLVNLAIASGTQISTRTSTVISKLTIPTSDSAGDKPVIIALTATSRAAGKLISIAEIAKREVAAKGGKVYQYNALTSRMVEMPRRVKKGAHGEGKEDESEDAFETMGEVKLSDKIKRNVPILTVYLSSVPAKELMEAYGEQT